MLGAGSPLMPSTSSMTGASSTRLTGTTNDQAEEEQHRRILESESRESGFLTLTGRRPLRPAGPPALRMPRRIRCSPQSRKLERARY